MSVLLQLKIVLQKVSKMDYEFFFTFILELIFREPFVGYGAEGVVNLLEVVLKMLMCFVFFFQKYVSKHNSNKY